MVLIAQFAAELGGNPSPQGSGGTTVPSGTTAPAAMIDPVPMRALFRIRAPMPITTSSSDDAAVHRGVVADRHPVAHHHRIPVSLAVQHGAILHIGVGAHTDRIHVAAHHGIHPHRGALAQRHVTNASAPTDPHSNLRESGAPPL